MRRRLSEPVRNARLLMATNAPAAAAATAAAALALNPFNDDDLEWLDQFEPPKRTVVTLQPRNPADLSTLADAVYGVIRIHPRWTDCVVPWESPTAASVMLRSSRLASRTEARDALKANTS